MKILGLIFTLALIQSSAKGQETSPGILIVDVFTSFHDIGFTDIEKKELLKTFRISNKETEITLELDTIENSILIQSCYVGGVTMPCDIKHIKSFKTQTNIYKIVYSSSTIGYADKHQNAFEVFNFNTKTKVLSSDPVQYKALNLSLKDFFKDNTPNSILEKYADNVEPIFSFKQNRIYCTISDSGYSNTLLTESFLRANVIEIGWTGETFILKEYKIEK